jgi:hypothetical protein
MKRLLKGSPLAMSQNVYEFNWLWIDDFTSTGGMAKMIDGPRENIVDGLDLTEKEKLWTFSATCPGTLANIWYVFAVGLKTLTITGSDGPQLENKYYPPSE